MSTLPWTHLNVGALLDEAISFRYAHKDLVCVVLSVKRLVLVCNAAHTALYYLVNCIDLTVLWSLVVCASSIKDSVWWLTMASEAAMEEVKAFNAEVRIFHYSVILFSCTKSSRLSAGHSFSASIAATSNFGGADDGQSAIIKKIMSLPLPSTLVGFVDDGKFWLFYLDDTRYRQNGCVYVFPSSPSFSNRRCSAATAVYRTPYK